MAMMQNRSISYKIKLTLLLLLVGIFAIMTFISYNLSTKIITDLTQELMHNSLNDTMKSVEDLYGKLDTIGALEEKSAVAKFHQQLFEKIKNNGFKKTGKYFIFDSKRQVAMHPTLSAGYIFPEEASYITQIIQSKDKEKELISFKFEGVQENVLCSYYDKWDWFLCLQVTDKEMFLERDSALKSTSLIFTIIFIISLTIILKFTSLISKTINGVFEELTKLSANIQNGVLKERISTETINSCSVEFRPLLHGLNDILVALDTPITKVRESMTTIGKGQIPNLIEENYKGDFESLKLSVNQCIKAIQKLINEINKLVEAAEKGNLSQRANEKDHLGDFQRIVNGFNRIFINILRPIEESNNVLSAVEKGDLRVRVQQEFNGDYHTLKMALNNSLNAMSSTLNEVKNDLNSVRSNAEKLAAISHTLSQGASEQAASLEQINSTMTKIGSQSRSNAENALAVKKLSEETQKSSQVGHQQINEMAKAMNEITSSSSEVSKIIKVIDEIAFQTNLLALNAAVEAARAGKHGKGFAIVAEEVRNLASRSATAAKETTELIASSQRKVDTGAQIAQQLQKAFNEILNGTEKVGTLINEITASSQEQAKEVGITVESLYQIDQAVQQTASSTEDTALLAKNLLIQTDSSVKRIDYFQL